MLGISRNPEFINSETLDMIPIPSPTCLKRYITGHKKYHSLVTLTEELQLNGGTRIPRKKNIVHLQNLMNITINLENGGFPVQNL